MSACCCGLCATKSKSANVKLKKPEKNFSCFSSNLDLKSEKCPKRCSRHSPTRVCSNVALATNKRMLQNQGFNVKSYKSPLGRQDINQPRLSNVLLQNPRSSENIHSAIPMSEMPEKSISPLPTSLRDNKPNAPVSKRIEPHSVWSKPAKKQSKDEAVRKPKKSPKLKKSRGKRSENIPPPYKKTHRVATSKKKSKEIKNFQLKRMSNGDTTSNSTPNETSKKKKKKKKKKMKKVKRRRRQRRRRKGTRSRRKDHSKFQKRTIDKDEMPEWATPKDDLVSLLSSFRSFEASTHVSSRSPSPETRDKLLHNKVSEEKAKNLASRKNITKVAEAVIQVHDGKQTKSANVSVRKKSTVKSGTGSSERPKKTDRNLSSSELSDILSNFSDEVMDRALSKIVCLLSPDGSCQSPSRPLPKVSKDVLKSLAEGHLGLSDKLGKPGSSKDKSGKKTNLYSKKQNISRSSLKPPKMVETKQLEPKGSKPSEVVHKAEISPRRGSKTNGSRVIETQSITPLPKIASDQKDIPLIVPETKEELKKVIANVGLKTNSSDKNHTQSISLKRPKIVHSPTYKKKGSAEKDTSLSSSESPLETLTEILSHLEPPEDVALQKEYSASDSSSEFSSEIDIRHSSLVITHTPESFRPLEPLSPNQVPKYSSEHFKVKSGTSDSLSDIISMVAHSLSTLSRHSVRKVLPYHPSTRHLLRSMLPRIASQAEKNKRNTLPKQKDVSRHQSQKESESRYFTETRPSTAMSTATSEMASPLFSDTARNSANSLMRCSYGDCWTNRLRSSSEISVESSERDPASSHVSSYSSYCYSTSSTE